MEYERNGAAGGALIAGTALLLLHKYITHGEFDQGRMRSMAWSQSEKDKARLLGLGRLEDKRVAFAESLKAQGLSFTDALLVQQGGGFQGVGRAGERLYLLTGPAPGDADADFVCERLDGLRASFEPFLIESEGMGGMLGMGKKGGRGYRLMLLWNGGEREMSFVPALMCILDVRPGDRFALAETARNKKVYNFVWDFPAIDVRAMDRIAARWAEMVP